MKDKPKLKALWNFVLNIIATLLLSFPHIHEMYIYKGFTGYGQTRECLQMLSSMMQSVESNTQQKKLMNKKELR